MVLSHCSPPAEHACHLCASRYRLIMYIYDGIEANTAIGFNSIEDDIHLNDVGSDAVIYERNPQ